LYVFGGDGVHGFSVAMVVGVISGSYSTVGIAVPLVYKPRMLYNISIAIATLGFIGLAFLVVSNTTALLVLIGLIVAGGAAAMVRTGRHDRAMYAGQPARA
jgi:hypothetical protein